MSRTARSVRLEKVLALAMADEKQKLLGLGRASGELSAAVERRHDLVAYRNNVKSQRMMSSRPSPVFADSRRFFEKLNLAISQQSEVIGRARLQADQARRVWSKEHQRVELLRKLIERKRRVEAQAENRLEQKRYDEVAQQSFVRPRT